MVGEIKYNIELLNIFCKENNLNILENFENTNINCNIKLTSKCINKDCNEFFNKKFHILYKTKVFTCKKCTWINGDKKHKQTLLNKYGTENMWDIEEIKNKKFDYAISRAVAPLKDLWKWAGPILHKKPDQANALICLKGGDLHQEIFESGLRPKMMSIHDIFPEAYFEEKFIIQVKKP